MSSILTVYLTDDEQAFVQEYADIHTGGDCSAAIKDYILMSHDPEGFQIAIADRLKARENKKGAKMMNAENEKTIEDGFGSVWSLRCLDCGRNSMQVVRPGKVQCQYCG